MEGSSKRARLLVAMSLFSAPHENSSPERRLSFQLAQMNTPFYGPAPVLDKLKRKRTMALIPGQG